MAYLEVFYKLWPDASRMLSLAFFVSQETIVSEGSKSLEYYQIMKGHMYGLPGGILHTVAGCQPYL